MDTAYKIRTHERMHSSGVQVGIDFVNAIQLVFTGEFPGLEFLSSGPFNSSRLFFAFHSYS